METLDPLAYLETLSHMDDEAIDLGKAGVALAALQQPGISTQRYLHHLHRLCNDVGVHYAERLATGAPESAATRLETLKHILCDAYDYIGDLDMPDHIQNANLIRVIDRAKGAAIALGLLFLQAGRAQGWHLDGLDFPGRFLCRIEKGGERLIFDPFDQCKVLEAADLRLLLKEARGPGAELSADYFTPVSNRHILLGLQNFIKFRQIALEDYKGALAIVHVMQMIDPGEYRLFLDKGVLHAKIGEPTAAIGALERYIEAAPYSRDRHEAEALLYDLRRSLN